MSLIKKPQLDALRTSFRTEFDGGLVLATPQFEKVATIVPSSSVSNTYGWLGEWPEMIEWVGPRQLKSLEEHGYVIINKKWESTVVVKVDDISDNNLGQYAPRFRASGMVVGEHNDKITFKMLKEGETELCYDGQPFFDTEHPVNAEHDGSGADVSVSNMTVDGGYAGPTWYLLDTTKPLKPLIFQQRKKPNFQAMDAPNDEGRFMEDKIRFGVDSRDNAGYGYWQLAHACKCELTYENVWAALEAMNAVQGDGGRELNIDPNMIVIPGTLERKAKELLNKERLANGEDNILHNRFEILKTNFIK
jgi:phage major head subunit gpT-like protein